METKIELSEEVRLKLSEAVILWADENLIGKPALLANAIYFALEAEFIKKAKGISERF
jgi:hypothetical protein